jgi:hypothetical protein
MLGAAVQLAVTFAVAWCYARAMLKRWEVEGGLRSLQPVRQHPRRARQARSDARRRVRNTVALLVAIGMVAVLGAARMVSTSVASLAGRQDSEWGDDYVGNYHIRRSAPLFPPIKRHGWRARAARDPITGQRSKLALE